MRWLFVARLRPFVLLAAAASLVLNLALLVPSLYMLQVFERVFASRSLETLLMLSLLGLVLVINVARMLLMPVLPVLIVAVVGGAVLRAVLRRQ